MAAIKFILQTKKNPSNIYARVMLKGKDIKRKTGLVIDPKKWNAKKGMPKDINETYIELTQIAERIWKGMNDPCVKDGEWLETTMHGSKQMLSDLVNYYIDNMDKIRNAKGGIGLSVNRRRNMESFGRKILEFKNVPVVNIDKSYGIKFIEWMEGYSNNYICKSVENLKTLVRYGKKNGFEINPTIFHVETFWEHKEPVILTLKELEHIKTLELNERLNNVRKWLLFGCFVGQRISDLFKLTEKDIKEVRGNKIIELKQEKTFTRVVIPLVPEALEAIKDGFPRKLSNQKFNVYLGELMELAEIDKKITSHCMRRSFASNHYGVIPTPLLMQITGHKKEATFLNYIGKSEYDMAFEFLEHYNKK